MHRTCGCGCLGHSCFCNEQQCPTCGCRPDSHKLMDARTDHCQTHSRNFQYGQECPVCSGSDQ